MKANGLMFGDWVKHLNNPQRIKGAVDFTLAKDFEPIPLTAEILVKIGFIVNGNKYRYSIFELIEDSMGDFFFKIGSNVIYVFHIHKLQHALRLCGLSEFANNFKV